MVMAATEFIFQCSFFDNRMDKKPRYRGAVWPKVVEGFKVHKERVDKDGMLWSPAIYKGNATRGNAGVESLTAAVADFDSGITYEEIKDRFGQYEHLAHTTHSHTEERHKFRVIIPFDKPVPVKDWHDIKARIDEHVFGQDNDPAAKDPARIYYTPSCPPGAPRFVKHHEGALLDPYVLPFNTKQMPKNGSVDSMGAVATSEGVKMPLGKTAIDFVANGAPLGEQRARALAAARNYLSAGYSVEDTAAALWRGLQISPQDPDRGPWIYDDALFIAQNIDKSDAPPTEVIAGPVPPRSEIRRTGLGYLCTFPTAGVNIAIDHIYRRSDGLKGEILVEALLPGVPRNLHWGSFNLSSVTARNTLAKYLEKRADLVSIDWNGILEDVCRKVAFAEREGEPPVDVGDQPEENNVTWMVKNVILNKEIGTIYGPGSTGKSRFALALALSVKTGIEFIPGFYPMETGEVLYLDWETEQAQINKRIRQLCRGREIDFVTVKYQKCKAPMTDIYEQVIKTINKYNIKLVVLDSVEAATAGTRDAGADQNAAVMALYQTLRMLGITVLLIDHVNSAQAKETKGVKKPYGSIFKYNYARYAFELRQATEDAQPGAEHLALYCTKYNDGISPTPVGIKVEFNDTSTVYTSEIVGSADLVEGMPQAAQIATVLDLDTLTVKEISAKTGIKSHNQVRAILAKNSDRFERVGEGKNTSWRNKTKF